MTTRNEAIEAMASAKETLFDAWDELETAVARQLEGWDDAEDRISAARLEVRTATAAAARQMDRALTLATFPDVGGIAAVRDAFGVLVHALYGPGETVRKTDPMHSCLHRALEPIQDALAEAAV